MKTFLRIIAACCVMALTGLTVFAQTEGQGENPVFRITKKYVPLNR